MQAGYNFMLPNRFIIGAEADASFPSFQNPSGISIGGISTSSSPVGAESYSETVLSSGTLRGRIGYAPRNWLLYATSGFAWTYDQLTLTQQTTGTTDTPFLWRLGWAAGAGVEVPVAPHWTASIQYLYTDYGHSNVLFANARQRFDSDLSLQELRAGLNYQFGDDAAPANVSAQTPDPDIVNFHGQTTFTWQGYPAFRSAYQGSNSLPASGEGRETIDATFGAGRWPGQGAVADRGRSRGAVMVASALNLHLKRRRLYAGRPSAALAIRKIASALNLHLKRRRLTRVCASHTRARRSPPQLAAFFFANPAGGAPLEQLRGRCRLLAAAPAS